MVCCVLCRCLARCSRESVSLCNAASRPRGLCTTKRAAALLRRYLLRGHDCALRSRGCGVGGNRLVTGKLAPLRPCHVAAVRGSAAGEESAHAMSGWPSGASQRPRAAHADLGAASTSTQVRPPPPQRGHERCCLHVARHRGPQQKVCTCCCALTGTHTEDALHDEHDVTLLLPTTLRAPRPPGYRCIATLTARTRRLGVAVLQTVRHRTFSVHACAGAALRRQRLA